MFVFVCTMLEVSAFSLSEVITVGYVETAVIVSESDGVAQLTVAISEADPIETSFNLLVSTMDGSAITTGLPCLNYMYL